MKNKSDEILKEYSQAIEANANTVVSKTGNARFAKYSAEELSKFPENIEEHSFGCGNPLSFNNVRQGDTVLDLGCGAGLDLLIAAEKVGETGRVIGLDFNEDMLSLAEKKVRDYPNIELRHGRIEELPIDSREPPKTHSIEFKLPILRLCAESSRIRTPNSLIIKTM